MVRFGVGVQAKFDSLLKILTPSALRLLLLVNSYLQKIKIFEIVYRYQLSKKFVILSHCIIREDVLLTIEIVQLMKLKDLRGIKIRVKNCQ